MSTEKTTPPPESAAPAKRRMGPIKLVESPPVTKTPAHPFLTGPASPEVQAAQQAAAQVRAACRGLHASARQAQARIAEALTLLDKSASARAALEVEALDAGALRAVEQKLKDLAAHFGG